MEKQEKEGYVTILILIDGFLQCKFLKFLKAYNNVTILILIDGFLQFVKQLKKHIIINKSQSLF